METVEEKMVNHLKDEIRTSTDSVFDSLVLEVNKAKLPEKVFKDHFLKYFAGEEQVSKDRNIVAEWVGVAGTPMNEVDVVNPAGDVIFTVPALFNTSALTIADKRAVGTFGEIVREHAMIGNQSPIAASKFINAALGHKAETIVTKADMTPTEKAWEKIMQYYKIGQDPQQTKVTEQSTDTDNDLVYE